MGRVFHLQIQFGLNWCFQHPDIFDYLQILLRGFGFLREGRSLSACGVRINADLAPLILFECVNRDSVGGWALGMGYHRTVV